MGLYPGLDLGVTPLPRYSKTEPSKSVDVGHWQQTTPLGRDHVHGIVFRQLQCRKYKFCLKLSELMYLFIFQRSNTLSKVFTVSSLVMHVRHCNWSFWLGWSSLVTGSAVLTQSLCVSPVAPVLLDGTPRCKIARPSRLLFIPYTGFKVVVLSFPRDRLG